MKPENATAEETIDVTDAPSDVNEKNTGRSALKALKSQTNDRFVDEKVDPAEDASTGEPDKKPEEGKQLSDTNHTEIKQSEGGLVDVDGKKYFYHPDAHAPGEKTRPNSYPSRDVAEDAAVHKVELMRTRIEALKADNKSIRTLGLPDALNGSADTLDEITEETIIAMDDDSLRQFLKQADQFDLKAAAKIDRVKSKQQKEQEKAQATDKFTQLQTTAEQTLSELGINPQEKKYTSPQEFFDDLDNAIEAHINNELQPLVKELQALEEDDDALDEMGQREFLRMVKQKTLDLQEKRDDFKRKYADKKRSVEAFIETAREVQGKKIGKKTELSDAQKTHLRKASIDEFNEDMTEVGKEINPDKMKAFSSWANRHRDNYNDLITTDDVYEAYHDWEEYIEKKRMELRGKQVSSEAKSTNDSKNSIKRPDPTHQTKSDTPERVVSKSQLKALAGDLNQKYSFK